MRLTYDRTRYNEQDMETTLGFLVAILYVLRIKPNSLLFLGVPCCSFSWVSSSKHCRSVHQPFGDTQHSFVVLGNKLCARSVLLALLGMTRGVFYFVENPMRSAISFYPYMKYLLSLRRLNSNLMQSTISGWCPRVISSISRVCCPDYVELPQNSLDVGSISGGWVFMGTGAASRVLESATGAMLNYHLSCNATCSCNIIQ